MLSQPEKTARQILAEYLVSYAAARNGEVLELKMTLFLCPRCDDLGVKSSYGNYCSNCGNELRGFARDPNSIRGELGELP